LVAGHGLLMAVLAHGQVCYSLFKPKGMH